MSIMCYRYRYEIDEFNIFVYDFQETLPSHTGNATYDYLMWLIGISLLVFALFMSSRMGIFQEQTYTKYGKHPAEAMFYNVSKSLL
ncbi:hypothetical protein SNE40_014340 [Patella caerulea]|uniref:Uncharacterized protein n=1 Tax=Patella caerulea TaxID=87958 RepID=A0AAN8JHT6_PATCE